MAIFTLFRLLYILWLRTSQIAAEWSKGKCFENAANIQISFKMTNRYILKEFPNFFLCKVRILEEYDEV